jgi:hypothetical protein
MPCARRPASAYRPLPAMFSWSAPDRSYVEWELEALGQRVHGVTVLTLDNSGLIANVALHHRPLGAVLAFSAEMGRRLGSSLGPDVFYQAAGSR